MDLLIDNKKIIKSKLYHFFQRETARLGQKETSYLTITNQSSISRAMHNPEKVSISWLVKRLKDMGFTCSFEINISAD